MVFWCQLESNLASQIHQNRRTIRAKMPSHVKVFLDEFLINFSSILGPNFHPPNLQKPSFSLRKNEVFSKNHLLKITSFRVRFCKPTCLNFGSQNPSKSSKNRSPRGMKNLMNFYFDFWSVFDRFGFPLGGQDGPKLNQKPNKKGCEKTSKNEARLKAVLDPQKTISRCQKA